MSTNPGDNINWFPGHMAKAKNKIKESIKLVDVVAEVIDARVPLSSKSLDINDIAVGKPLILVMNKSDLADDKLTNEWVEYYQSKDIVSVCTNCNLGKGIKEFITAVKNSVKDKVLIWQSKGIKANPIRIMIIGHPNTGKSSLINRLAKQSKTKIENRPGVTRSIQWVTIDNGIELLDTPGILPKKINSKYEQENLAFTGAIKDDVLDMQHISFRLLDVLCKEYPERVKMRYRLNEIDIKSLTSYEILQLIGKSRGFLITGGEVDFERTAKMIISEFRSGKMGGVTLEKVSSLGNLSC